MMEQIGQHIKYKTKTMKKIFFIAALFLASMAADAQEQLAYESKIIIGAWKPVPEPIDPCIVFKVSGANLSGNLPEISPDGKNLKFNYSVVIYIEKIGTGKFEKVDNATFVIPINQFNPLTVTEVMNDSAEVYVTKNYPDIK